MFGIKRYSRHYEEAAQRYESRPLETGKILFFGDSFFTRCSDFYCANHPEKGHAPLEKTLLMRDGSKAAINHGLGGSGAGDLLYYYDRLVRPYKPRALVISTGSNDRTFGYSPDEVMNILAIMIDWFRADFPGAPIYCLKAMPSIKHKGQDNDSTRFKKEFNELLETYCAEKKVVRIIDLYHAPFYFEKPEDIGNTELVREDIFDDDQVHFNAVGYDMFIDFLRGILDKDGLL